MPKLYTITCFNCGIKYDKVANYEPYSCSVCGSGNTKVKSEGGDECEDCGHIYYNCLCTHGD